MAFALASAGAVTTSSEAAVTKDGAVLINGWVQNPDPFTCSERKNLDCGNDVSKPVCMSFDNLQAYQKDNAGQCTVELHKRI